jgi:FMN phosphatase YigB (HAD superfamily)
VRVGFDLDGVVYDFRGAQSTFEVARGNSHCSLDLAADHWDYFEGWGWDVDQWLVAYAEGVDAGHILRVGEPLPGAVEAFRDLRAAGHSIHIVTDRSIGVDPEGATRAWLAEHGLVYDSLTFSRDKTVAAVDVFIEDRLENADALNAAGIPCYLINRPWNYHEDDRLRVDTLTEYVARVNDMQAMVS